MCWAKLAALCAIVISLAAFTSAATNSSNAETKTEDATASTSVFDNQIEGRNKKMDKMMKDMYMAFMIFKNMISFMLMFVSPIIQIKGFGLSVINTLVNIGRFLLQMQANKQMEQWKSTASYSAHLEHRYDSGASQYAYYSPPPKQDWGLERSGYDETAYPYIKPSTNPTQLR